MRHAATAWVEGRFELRERLGQGAQGETFAAWDNEHGVEVAIKRLVHSGAQALYRFKREFRVATEIQHPNLVTLRELIENAGEWYLVMERLSGVDLVDALTTTLAGSSVPETAADWPRVCRLMAQLVSGVSALHDAGVIHRDIKPSNILVDSNDRLVVLDFGLATNPDADGSTAIAGSPHYMSPEQVASQPLGPASDFYAIGVLLYHFASGRFPFEGDWIEVMSAKHHHDAPELELASAPAPLVKLINRLLARDPRQRPAQESILLALQGLQASAPSPDYLATRSSPPPSLIGRNKELRQLLHAFEQRSALHPHLARVGGTSGMGKTMLIDAFLHEAKQLAEPPLIIQGRSLEREFVPFKGLDSSIDRLTRLLRRSAIKLTLSPQEQVGAEKLFPVLTSLDLGDRGSSSLRELGPTRTRRRGILGLRRILQTMTEHAPVIWVMDDLQWGDVDSVRLLDEIFEHPGAPPIFICLLHRSEDMSIPALRTMTAWVQAQGESAQLHIDLQPLSVSETKALVMDLASKHSSPARPLPLEQIVQESAGIPFYAGELTRWILSTEAQRYDTTQPSLETAVIARAQTMSPEAMRLLRVACLVTRPTRLSVLTQAAETAEASTSARRELLHAQLLREELSANSTPTLVPFHDQVRKVVIHSLDKQTLIGTHEKIALALEERDADLARIAYHFAASGHPERTAEHALLTANRAHDALAFEQAAEGYEMTTRLLPASDSRRHILLHKRGQALRRLGRGDDAASAFLQAHEEAPEEARSGLLRDAARVLLDTGHVDRAYEILERVLPPAGLRFPQTPARAAAGVLYHRAHLSLRGLRHTPREESTLNPKALARLDLCWSTAIGLAMVDPVRAAYFQAQHLRVALSLGDSYRVARAASIQLAFQANKGSAGRDKNLAFMRQVRSLVSGRSDPYLNAVMKLGEGLIHFHLGEWSAADQYLQQSLTLFREQVSEWMKEAVIAQMYRAVILVLRGDLKTLSQDLPSYIKQAEARGHQFALTNLQSGLLNIRRLIEDRPDLATEEADRAIMPWSRDGVHVQHFLDLLCRTQIDLYEGRPHEAWSRLDREAKAFRRSLLGRVQWVRIWITEFRGRAALAASETHAELLPSAIKEAKNLRAEDIPWASGLAGLLESAIARVQGERARAATLAMAASKTFESSDMALYARAASWRAAELLPVGDPQARRLRSETHAWLAAQGVVAPERLMRVLAPAPGPSDNPPS